LRVQRRVNLGPLAGGSLALATGLFAIYCFVLAMSSTPRRVGDGVEYWAMAEQMRTGRLPSASHGELIRLEREAVRIGRGYDKSPVRFEGLVGADGRQDFPHFWLYPLVNVPALAVVTAFDIHPNWAFTLTNIILITIAFALVARHVSVAWAVLILAGPLIWWIDKAHGDVFTVSLLAIGCALWRAAPSWSVIAIALAAAQNPALMPVSVIVSITALWCARAGDHQQQQQQQQRRRRVAAAVGAGAAIVAVPLVYYKLHLGVWSPLIGYTHPVWPSMRAMLSLLFDPNIGLLPNVPFLAIAGLGVIAMTIRRTPRISHALAAFVCVLLLAAFAQSVNLNHGATPGLNRWTLWLTPWLLLIAAAAPSASAASASAASASARMLAALAVLHMLWAGWFFRPSQPEVYRYPTLTASWLWTHAPRWYEPAPEIFAERVSHGEPALLPTATPGCTKALIIDGRWPAGCTPPPPASVPPECLGADRLCYATQSSPTTFTPLGVASFPWLPAP